MIYLLYIALGYLLCTSLVLLHNRRAFTPLLSADRKYFDEGSPLLSICIPARDEERSIERCLRSALNQNYPNVEVLVLDDGSTDATPRILERMQQEYPQKMKYLQGKSKPAGWLGKPWACSQLADEAGGRILLFIDADTWLGNDMGARLVRTMGHDVVDLLTVWPQQKLESFWEKTVLPLVYYALLSLLPARYVYRTPRWLPGLLKRKLSPLFSAACGQCMAFRRKAYDAIGGHRAVKDRVVEDVQLAKEIKKNGYTMKMFHGRGAISCRMYRSAEELHAGFSKNFLAGFGFNIPLFVFTGLLHLVVYVLPFLVLPAALLYSGALQLSLLSALAIVIILWHRLMLARWFDWSMSHALLHPLAVLWFQKLGVECLVNYVKGVRVPWKGREV